MHAAALIDDRARHRVEGIAIAAGCSALFWAAVGVAVVRLLAF